MHEQSKHDLFEMGVHDAVAEFFNADGPEGHGGYGSDGDEEVIWLDFIHESTECYMMTSSGFPVAELASIHSRSQAKLYYLRGKEAGRELIEKLARDAISYETLRYRRGVRAILWVEKLFRNSLDNARKMCNLLVENARYYDRRFTR